MELISKLGIDLKIIIAQMIIFFILLFILYKFVYQPVLDMLEKRSKTIEKGIHDAKESEKKLLEIEQLGEAHLAEAEKEIGKLFEKARLDAETMKKEMSATASAEAQDVLRRNKLQITEEKTKMLEEVKAEMTAYIIKSASKLLEREFSETDQKRLEKAIVAEMKSV